MYVLFGDIMGRTAKTIDINIDSQTLEDKISPSRKRKNPSVFWSEAIVDGERISDDYKILINKGAPKTTDKEKAVLADIHFNWAHHLNVLCEYSYSCYQEFLSKGDIDQATISFDKVFSYSEQRLNQITIAFNMYPNKKDKDMTTESLNDYEGFHQVLINEKELIDSNDAFFSVAQAHESLNLLANTPAASITEVNSRSKLFMNTISLLCKQKNPAALWSNAIVSGDKISDAYQFLINKAVVNTTDAEKGLLADIHFNCAQHLNALFNYTDVFYRESCDKDDYIQAKIYFDKLFIYSEQRLEHMKKAYKLYPTKEQRAPVVPPLHYYRGCHQYSVLNMQDFFETLFDQQPTSGVLASVTEQTPISSVVCDSDSTCAILKANENNGKKQRLSLTNLSMFSGNTTTNNDDSLSNSTANKLF